MDPRVGLGQLLAHRGAHPVDAGQAVRVVEHGVGGKPVHGERGNVIGDVISLALGLLGGQVGHIDDLCGRAGDGSTDAGHGRRRQHRGVQAAGSEDHLVGRDDGVDRVAGHHRIRRFETQPHQFGRRGHLDLAPHPALRGLAEQGHRIDRSRQHPAHRAEGLAQRVEHSDQVAAALAHHRTEQQVAGGVARHLAGLEAMLQPGGQQRFRRGEGDQALAQVAGHHVPARPSQTAGGTPVIADGHNAADVIRVAPDGPEGRRQAVPSTDRHHVAGHWSYPAPMATGAPQRSRSQVTINRPVLGGGAGRCSPRCATSRRSARPSPPSGACRRCTRGPG